MSTSLILSSSRQIISSLRHFMEICAINTFDSLWFEYFVMISNLEFFAIVDVYLTIT